MEKDTGAVDDSIQATGCDLDEVEGTVEDLTEAVKSTQATRRELDEETDEEVTLTDELTEATVRFDLDVDEVEDRDEGLDERLRMSGLVDVEAEDTAKDIAAADELTAATR